MDEDLVRTIAQLGKTQAEQNEVLFRGSMDGWNKDLLKEFADNQEKLEKLHFSIFARVGSPTS